MNMMKSLFSKITRPTVIHGRKIGNLVYVTRRAFAGRQDLTNIIISGEVDVIEEDAFKDCKRLRSVIIEEGIRIIASGAFMDCIQLEKMILPSSLMFLYRPVLCDMGDMVGIVDETDDYGPAYGVGVFQGCTSLRRIVLPRGIDRLPRRVFSGCVRLEEVVFTADSVCIDFYAFEGCKQLIKIDLSRISSVVPGSFCGCSMLASKFRRRASNRYTGLLPGFERTAPHVSYSDDYY